MAELGGCHSVGVTFSGSQRKKKESHGEIHRLKVLKCQAFLKKYEKIILNLETSHLFKLTCSGSSLPSCDLHRLFFFFQSGRFFLPDCFLEVCVFFFE